MNSPFLTFTFTAGEKGGDDVSLTIVAPSVNVAWKAFKGMTTPKRLNALAVSFMPEEDDEFDDLDDDDDYY